jgi:hypothetical protein
MLMPALAVAGGIFTAYLAISSNNALVVGEYWREGKAINHSLAKEAHAKALGLELRISQDGNDLSLQLLSVGQSVQSPNPIRVQWIHPTLSGRDRAGIAMPLGQGYYRIADFTWPQEGHWQLMAEDAGGAWRMKTVWSASNDEVVILP